MYNTQMLIMTLNCCSIIKLCYRLPKKGGTIEKEALGDDIDTTINESARISTEELFKENNATGPQNTGPS